MKLYLKQRVISIVDSFTVKDENGKDVYTVKGELISLGKKLHIYNTANKEVCCVNQKIISLLPTYYITKHGKKVASIVKEISLVTAKYSISEYGWIIRGDIFEHDYQILAGNYPVANIHKKWMSWGDSYEIDIVNDMKALDVLSVVIAIDCVVANQNKDADIRQRTQDNVVID